MFGVVPRVIWERSIKPDEKNRILIGLNTLLVRTAQENILIDTGIGEKWSAKELEIYAISHPPTIISSLAKLGLTPEDISIVINTHLHFDHAGGNTEICNGQLRPTFPNARYYVQRSEFEHAAQPHERDRASYLPDDWQPMVETNQWHLLDGDGELLPGVELLKVPGHNLDTQLVKITSGGKTALFCADIIPTTMHIPFAWNMGYDLYPVELLAQKRALIPQAAREEWLCIFEHDAAIPWGKIVEIEPGKKYKVDPLPH